MNPKRIIVAAIPVALVLLLAVRAIDSDVHEGGEAREALVAREMVRTNDWILPLWNGIVVPSKPPLFHWMVAGATRLTGGDVTERSLRAPSILLSGVVVLMVLLSSREAGWLAALVLATTPQFLTEASDGRVDMTLCTAITGAQLAVVRALGGGGALVQVVLALCLGLAMLAKGPVGPGLVGLTALAFALRERELRPVLRLVRPVPVLVFLAVAGSWCGAAYLHRGWDFVAKQIVSENGEALLGGERFPYRSPLFYVQPLILAGLPWTLFLPWAARRAWRGNLLERYAIVWAATVFTFFALAPLKRAAYLLPLRPALALVVGSWLAAVAREERQAGRLVGVVRVLAIGVAIVGVLLALATFGVSRGLVPLERLAAPAARAEIDLETYRRTMVAREGELIASGVAVALTATLAARALARARWREAAIAGAATTAAAAFVLLGLFVPARAAQKSIRPFALEVRERIRPTEPLTLLASEEEIPFIFYLGRSVPLRAGPVSDVPPGYYVLDQKRWESGRMGDGWQEVIRSGHVFSRHRNDLVLVRRR
jgi:hypothetical protein